MCVFVGGSVRASVWEEEEAALLTTAGVGICVNFKFVSFLLCTMN